MTLLKLADGTDKEQCDGCGRTDAGPGSPLGMREYAVMDPNVGSMVSHHYCPGCAANRNASIETLSFDWPATPAPVVRTVEVDDRAEAKADLPADEPDEMASEHELTAKPARRRSAASR